MKAIKVLYISYDGLTDPLGQSQVLPYLQLLCKKGYEFTILSFEKKHRFRKEEGAIRKIIDNIAISWVPLTFTSKPPVISKIYDRLRMLRKATQLQKVNKFHILHCRSYIAAEVGLKMKAKYGTKFLFDMRGFWADEKIDNGQWDINKYFFKKVYNHYKQKEKLFLLGADGVISLTEAAREYLLKEKDYRNLEITVIPCCADLEHFDYSRFSTGQINSLKERLGISTNSEVVTYLGSVGGWYMTKEMFKFFQQLSTKYPQYHLLILTKDDPKVVVEEALACGVERSKITVTYAERDNVPLHLSLSSVGLFFIRNTFSKIASSPTKHAEMMGMGIPVICNNIGDTGKIISSTGTGIVIDEFTPKAMEEVIDKVKGLQSIPPQKVRDAAKQFFDLSVGVEKYLKVYQNI